MKQLNKNCHSFNTPTAADAVADRASEDNGAIEQQQFEEGEVHEDGETDNMSPDTRVAKLIATQPDSDVLSHIYFKLQLTGKSRLIFQLSC